MGMSTAGPSTMAGSPSAGGGGGGGTLASPSLPDPILPSLRSIRASYDDYLRNPAEAGARLHSLLEDCIHTFSDNSRYRNDERFLKICIIYADVGHDFERVFGMLEEKGICQNSAMLYESYAMFHIGKENLLHANNLYMIGIHKFAFGFLVSVFFVLFVDTLLLLDRNAEPLDNLKKSHAVFLKHVGRIIQNAAPRTAPICEIEAGRPRKLAKRFLNPYSSSVVDDLVRKMDAKLKKLNGYYRSSKHIRKGKVLLASLRTNSMNNIIELGSFLSYRSSMLICFHYFLLK